MSIPNTSSDLGDLLDGHDSASKAGPSDDTDDRESESDDWLTPLPHMTRLPRLLPAALAGGTLLAVAFTGGVLVQKQHDHNLLSTASAPAGFGAGRGAGFAAGGAPGTATAPTAGAGTTGPAVIGQIVSRNGPVLTIRNLSGKTVQVTVPPTTTITRQLTLTLAKLARGSNVVVTGTTSPSGAITASAITVH